MKNATARQNLPGCFAFKSIKISKIQFMPIMEVSLYRLISCL